jgi:RND family efflux transporter MFP subunit
MTRVFVLLSAVTAAACGVSPGDEVRQAEPLDVRVAAAAVRDVPVGFEAGGVIQARASAVVASRIAARIEEVHVRPGDRVRAGQAVVRLDERDLAADRRRALAAVTAAERAKLAAEAEQEAARAALALAGATRDRIVALHARKSATSNELDQAVAAQQGAAARLRAAEARVAEADAALEGARAAAEAADVRASFALLTAPFDGVVTERLADPGTLATQGGALLRLDAADGLRLAARIDGSRATQVAVGAPVGVVLARPADTGAQPFLEIAGTVAEIARDVDASALAFVVRVTLPAHPDLRSGLFARARFAIGTRRALTIPGAAIVPRGQLQSVFVVSDGVARMRVLQVGESTGQEVEVVAGLAEGDHVIVAPIPQLSDGDPVRASSGAPPAGGR